MPALRRLRSPLVVTTTALAGVLALCTPSYAGGSWDTTDPAPPSPPPKTPDPSTISSQVHYSRSYHGSGARMTSSAATWSPPVCWYEPTYSPQQMEDYLTTHYEAEHIAEEVIGQDDPGGIDYHTGEKGAWWKLVIPDTARGGECDAPHSWLWVTPTTPSSPQAPVIDPKTLAGLAYDRTVLPEPDITLRPTGQNQLVNLDTEVRFDKALPKVWVTARLDNAAFGVHVAATTTAVPTRLTIDAGTADADPASCTYDLTGSGGKFSVDTKGAGCNVTYRKASPHGGYRLTASVVWKVTWTPSADPDGPPQARPALPDGQSSRTFPVTVRENVALNR
jgi:enoyl reductase